ncbi:MAG: hypothetical protein EFT35_04700 [Methanophagales archaeon ANME-1-THS]|nr:MAG: hypothetical protein EFT35_04700 [Methanophagales archaeon ANME-1-THS]
MDNVNLLELTKHIVRLQKEIYQEFTGSEQMNPHKARLLADCLDYFLYLVLDQLEGRGEYKTQELVDQLMRCEAYCKKELDRLHADFFATLLQLISAKYNITMLRGKASERAEFEQSWKRTREELGI